MSKNNNSPFTFDLSIEEAPKINNKVNGNLVLRALKGIKVNDNREYYKFLDDLLKSPTHSACLGAKVDYIISNHLLVDIKNNEVEVNDFVISQNDDITDLLTKVANDYELYNGFAIEVIKAKGGGLGSIEYVPFKDIVFSLDKAYLFENNELKELSLFDEKSKSGIYIYKPCKFDEVPTPNYSSAFNSINTEISAIDFHLSNTSSGFSSGAFINFIEDVERTEEEKKKIANRFRERTAGAKNGGSVHVNFSTKEMREKGGLKKILEACEKLKERHLEHIKGYGEFNEKRLTGKHETSSMESFSFGNSDRGSSIRIPVHTYTNERGYFEDRRPAANCDPYKVSNLMIETVFNKTDITIS